MLENEEIDENLAVVKGMKRLKHLLVLITFGIPMFFVGLYLLFWVISFCVKRLYDIFQIFNFFCVCAFSYGNGMKSPQM